MNVTELARKVKIPTSELKDLLPQLGFDIGRKAIKVDDKVAEKIIKKIKDEPRLVLGLRKKSATEEEEKPETPAGQSGEITIPAVITVRDFSSLINKPVATVIQELMKNGILANLNEQIDYETAAIIAQDFGLKTKIEEKKESEANDSQTDALLADDEKNLSPRPPVVVVMGHVDHGKTQLLDTIRKTNVVDKESGGITQHIGAYQIKKNEKLITFIDTPGHAAFTAMRSRGARMADIAIVVIAADDGIKPQTEEVLKIISGAKIPFLVAINKIDKPEANVEKVKQQLAEKNLLPEDWGGKIICAPVSAKNGQGIESLLEQLLLLAEMEKDSIRANPDREAVGTVVESHIDKGEGPVATVIIRTGTLKKNDNIKAGKVVGRIKAMKNHLGKTVKQAKPSMPVKIIGLKSAPEVGDAFQVIKNRESLKKIMKGIKYRDQLYRDQQKWQTAQTKNEDQKKNKKYLNLILKADTLGSQEAILQSLEMLQLEKVKIKIVKKGLGNINDLDVLQAKNTAACIYGFNIKAEHRAQEIAQENSVHLHLYQIIYDLINHVKKEVEKLVEVEKKMVEIGRIKVLAVFRTEKSSMIIGGLVTKGRAEAGAAVKILRQDKIIGEAKIAKLQQNKQESDRVPSGTECGVEITGATNIQTGDFLEISREEIISPAKIVKNGQ